MYRTWIFPLCGVEYTDNLGIKLKNIWVSRDNLDMNTWLTLATYIQNLNQPWQHCHKVQVIKLISAQYNLLAISFLIYCFE